MGVRGANTQKCKAPCYPRAVVTPRATPGLYRAPVIHFTPSSFEGSPALQRLNDEIERAWLMRDGQGVVKAVAVHVTARIEAFSPPQDRYLLRVLDASDVRLMDTPADIGSPSGLPEVRSP